VPLRKADLFTKNIPSKIYEIMASSRPIIISTEGESRRLVERCGAGLGSRPEDSRGLAEKILYLSSDSDLCHEMGQSGLAFVLANSSRNRLADSYLSLLQKTVGENETLNQLETNRISEKAEKNNRSKESVSI
jgi:glycosyltransferase involved in cell wall biosynthesis